MLNKDSFFNRIIQGDSLEILPQIPESSIDLVFSDPPYNLQLKQDLWRPNHTQVVAVNDDWDQFDSFKHYDEFTRDWLKEVRRVMKPTATIWVSGTYHNIFRVGAIMQNMGFWLLNTITWFRPNAMPNFRGMRLKNDVEFIIWAKYSEESRYTFHHHLVKRFNDFSPEKQLGCVWQINLCGGPERLRDGNGDKLHPTQKPEELLERIILASSKPDEVVLDPFSGTGTSAAVAKRLRRQYIAIEAHESYYQASIERIHTVKPLPEDAEIIQAVYHEKPPRVAFKKLLKAGYIEIGQKLYLDEPATEAIITRNAKLQAGNQIGSIHSLACHLKDVPSINGWRHWFYEAKDGSRYPIDMLRYEYKVANEQGVN
jgi:DNA modification methylase